MFKWVAALLLLALISGCTTSQLFKDSMTNGDQNLKEGKYKEAVDSYRTALSEEKEDKEAEEKLAEAQKKAEIESFFQKRSEDWTTVFDRNLVDFVSTLNAKGKESAHQQLKDTITLIKQQKVPDDSEILKYNAEFTGWLDKIYEEQDRYYQAYLTMDIATMKSANEGLGKLYDEIGGLKETETRLKQTYLMNSKIETAKEETINKEELVKEAVPEPYSIAIGKIESADFETAIKYLDYTISDFADTPFAYHAKILKSIVIRSKLQANASVANAIGTGAVKGRSLLSDTEFSTLRKKMDQLTDSISENTIDLSNLANEIYDNYDNLKDSISITNIGEISIPDTKDLSFFMAVGYPLPQDDEIHDYYESIFASTAAYLLQEMTLDEKFSFPDYFFYMGNAMDKKHRSSAKKLLGKTIELTETDKYNEIRNKAQEILDTME